jgi:lysozyme
MREAIHLRVNAEALALIKAFEGFRGKAYRCPAGVWTVGYGHTSMAGPPDVRPGLRMSKGEAAAVLAKDVDAFARDIGALIRVQLNDNQFGALVSFAYNVGVGAFRKSSVLSAVNAGEMDKVPRRLNLWVKAGGRTLPGLMKRRAAEGALFATSPLAHGFAARSLITPAPSEIAEMDDARGLIDVPAGTGMLRSTTNWAAIGQFFATASALVTGAATKFREATWDAMDFTWFLPEASATNIVIGFAAVATLVWIISERRKKAVEDDV